MNTDLTLKEIASYVEEPQNFDEETYRIASLILKDSMGCMIKSMNNEECLKMLGPLEKGNYQKDGVYVPGQKHALNLTDASWNYGVLVRWLDYNDCFLAEEWGHPSDNLGGLLAVAYKESEENDFTVKDILTYMIKAHEIQGGLSLKNSLNRNGFDHVFFVKLATAAVVAKILGGDKDVIINTISNVFVDGASLRAYRHSPNVTTRKSWAAGDATKRGVELALLTRKINEGYPNILTEPVWGFDEVIMNNNGIKLVQPLHSYVVNNILFKADFPAEFHAQTAAEVAMQLHEKYKKQLDNIAEIKVNTHESAMRIIANKTNLTNQSDRDHSLEYIIAVSLLSGDLKTEYYSDVYHHSHPKINEVLSKMNVQENLQYSEDYLNPEKRSVSNSVQLVFSDGTYSEEIEVEYPIGHKFRRREVDTVIDRKFRNNISDYYEADKAEELEQLFEDQEALFEMNIRDFLEKF